MRSGNSADNGDDREGDEEMMRRELNEFQNDVLKYTGLSIPRFAHRRNRIRCCDCYKWIRASKNLPKEMVQDDKDADAFGLNIHPGIVCGKCGRKYWTKADEKFEIIPRSNNSKKLKIRKVKKMLEKIK